ncbi:MAG: hypothetical protein F6K56_11250 [Moorea sp. SIO3G5]|nr:hypothetical protein [Moorena sp. SIO3G5]
MALGIKVFDIYKSSKRCAFVVDFCLLPLASCLLPLALRVALYHSLLKKDRTNGWVF